MAVTQKQAQRVLAEVAQWLGEKGYGAEFGKPAPTGPEAARQGIGPMLQMDPAYTGAPAIVLEGDPYDWAISCSFAVQDRLKAAGIPVFVEPYAGWALNIYPA